MMNNKDFHVLALVKGDHQFVYIFDEMGWDELVETLCEQAEDSNLDFTWFDAALLSHRAKTQIEAANEEQNDENSSLTGDEDQESEIKSPITSRLPR
jgi:hypothetical protein